MQANSTTPQAATPQFSVAPGVYSGTQTVTITDSTPGATIYYSTNGLYPYAATFDLYSGPFTVSSSEVVVAYAAAPGYTGSAYAIGRYIISSVPSSFVYTVAGNGSQGYSGDGGPALAAQVSTQQALAVDANGNLYIADTWNKIIRKVTASTGIISTIAGTGVAGNTGDGGPAVNAEIGPPQFIAVDQHGNIYIADVNGTIRTITASNGNISTIATNVTGITGMAIDSSGNVFVNTLVFIVEFHANTWTKTTVSFNDFNSKYGLAIDAAGFLYFAEGYFPVIERLDPKSGTATVVAGTASPHVLYGDGGPATSARLDSPIALAFDSAGNLYIEDETEDRVRVVKNGIINTAVGNGGPYSAAGDGDPAQSFPIEPTYGNYFAVSPGGKIYFTSLAGRIMMATAPAPPPTQFMPAPTFSVAAGTYASPQKVAVSSSVAGASLYLSTDGTNPNTNQSGYYGPVNVPGNMTITAIASAPGYLPSSPASAKYAITAPPTSIISTIAGTGQLGFVAAGGPAASTPLETPTSAVADASGNIYIADADNHVVWKVDASTGNMSLFAGTGHASSTGDGGPATAATFDVPVSVAVDQAGNVYVADETAQRIRKIAASTGIITTVAGPGSVGLGDGGPATSAKIGDPLCVIVDKAGNFYIGGYLGVRKVDVSTGIISTIAGSASATQPGDGGPATAGEVAASSIAFDSKGNLFIVDQGTNSIREVDAQTGIITSVAGNGNSWNSGDGGPALQASLNPEYGIAVDASGDVYFTTFPYSVREIDAKNGTISTVIGTGYAGYGGDGGAAGAASMDTIYGLSFDASGNLLIADSYNSVIRKVTYPPPAAAPTFSPAAGAYTGVQTVKFADSTANATIYYTTDGSTPDTGSTQYSGPITVSKSETVKAIAVASGFAESPVASAAYTITIPTPSIALTSSVNPVATSIPVTFTATLTSTYGTPTGTVTFLDGATQLGTGTLTGGIATYTTSSLSVGSHSITAIYVGDSNFTSVSSAPLAETITIPVPSVALTSSANPALVTGAVTITATVSSTYGSPTGTVTFLDGATQIASATLSNGTASFTTSSLAVGSHSITAVYGGDSHFASASSSALNETIEDFTISTPSSGSTSATVAPGGLTSYALTVSPLPVSTTFSVSGLPNGATATFNPPTVQPSNTATSVTLTIQLPASAAATPHGVRPFEDAPLVLGFVLLPFLGLRRFRRGLGGKLLLIAFALAGFAGLGSVIGCGGDSSGISSGSKQPPKTYTLTVTATAGTLSHTETLTLTVQ